MSREKVADKDIKQKKKIFYNIGVTYLTDSLNKSHVIKIYTKGEQFSTQIMMQHFITTLLRHYGRMIIEFSLNMRRRLDCKVKKTRGLRIGRIFPVTTNRIKGFLLFSICCTSSARNFPNLKENLNIYLEQAETLV